MFKTVAIFIVSCFVFASAQQLTHAREVILEGKSLLVAFDSNSGALTRLESKSPHWVIERRPKLGVSFRINALLPNHKNDTVLGRKQRAVVVINQEFSKPITAKVNLPHPGKLAVATPEHPDVEPADGVLKIPPRSSAVVMEQ